MPSFVLPIVLLLMILLIGIAIGYFAVRQRSRQQRTGEESRVRRERRGDQRP